MDIVYSSSDAYSEIAGVSIYSLFLNNQEVDDITVYIIDNGISDINRERLLQISEKFKRNLIFLKNINIEQLTETKINVGRWHISTFYRLFLGSILPESVERVIYIDCDMIILQSLKNVWKMDFAGMFALGADDCRGSAYRINIGLEPNHIYINNGFLLINLRAWRQNNVEQQYIDFIHKYKGDITYMDQGVLNGVLGSQNLVGLLPPSYNAQTVFYDFNYKQITMYRRPVWAYSEETLDQAISNPVVVHFTSCFISGTRPWNEKNNHPYRAKFLEYRSQTPWADMPLWKDDRKLAKKIMTVVCRWIPKAILLRVFAVLHSKLYPMVRNIKNGIQA